MTTGTRLVRAIRDPLTRMSSLDLLCRGKRNGIAPALRRWPSLVLALVVGFFLVTKPVHHAAASDSATPTAGFVEEIWVDAEAPAGAQPGDGPQSLAVFRVVWDTGAGYRFQEKTPGLGINCVLDGQWSFRPDRDELVVRAGAEPVPAPAATETALDARDCAILHQDVPRDERNSGTESVEFLAIALLPDNTPPPANGPEALEFAPVGFLYAGNWSGTPDGPDGPRHVTLRQIALAPDASAAMPTVAGNTLLMVTSGTLGITPSGGKPLVERAVSFESEAPAPVDADVETVLETGDSAHFQDGTTIAIHNASDEPATYWLLTLEPVGGAATPVP